MIEFKQLVQYILEDAFELSQVNKEYTVPGPRVQNWLEIFAEQQWFAGYAAGARDPQYVATRQPPPLITELINNSCVASKPTSTSATRLSIIDHREDGKGLVMEVRDATISYAFQDDGLTLKVWITHE